MDDVLAALREAFEAEDYDVTDVSRNRDQVRVVVLEEGANADELRSITERVVADDAAFGLDVTTESVDGAEGMNTVVTFRYRDGHT